MSDLILYCISRKDDGGSLEQTQRIYVYAKDAAKARKLASEFLTSSESEAFLDPKITTARRKKVEEGVVAVEDTYW